MTDERRDDEIIGRALSRAIETIDVNQTPFERSRIGMAPARRGFFGVWQIASAAAAIVLALAIGSWLTRPAEDRGPVAASPTAPAGSSSPSTTAPPASATPAQDRIWVYFARDGLPPTGGFATGRFDDSRPDTRILSRLDALRQAKTGIPAGATNTFAAPTPTQSGSGSFSISARVQGDLATVEFDISGGWGVRGSAQSQALLQQLVYTITEEPGIRRALITEKGKPNAVIDQIVIDKPLTREDVFGYTGAAMPQSIEDAGDDTVAEIVDWRASVDQVAPGLGRFVVELKPTNSTEPHPYPEFTATLQQETSLNPDTGKWVIRVAMPDAVWLQAPGEAFHCCPAKTVGKTPIRYVAAGPLTAAPPTGNAYRGVVFGIYLDDARPWRVGVLHNPLRLVVDVGGVPQATSDRVAVYAPRAGETSRTVTISGFARVYEATVSWRITDSAGREVAKGFTNASIGTSPVWGSFETTATIPANVSGNVTLEVFEASAKDGSPQGVVQVPLTVR
jgi:hypothetical protein